MKAECKGKIEKNLWKVKMNQCGNINEIVTVYYKFPFKKSKENV